MAPLAGRRPRITCRVRGRARELAGHLISWSLVRGIELPAEDELTLQVQRPDDFFRQFAALVVERGIDVMSLETTDVSAEAIFDYVMSSTALGG